ncbi:hypothetical protein B0A48_04836 [Cryoendolithus antarcticus]|uniref:Uncharacterized protein n=1 Tax=Cryoendolithus antarcticus TaxID=1507870 RepID=A0A1V8TDF9_9PEZI|nr:hypothetical protein B0A48_04836 [Cryoendolithus antarcticus]
MQAISSTSAAKSLTPNILPCSIRHSGPVGITKQYWSPTSSSNGTSSAYFRGRKLRGKTVKLPAGYEGVLLEKTEKQIIAKPAAPTFDENGELEEVTAVQDVETKVMDRKASFEEVVVWGHDALPEGGDEFVKGLGEWMGFAEAIHTYDDVDSDAPS